MGKHVRAAMTLCLALTASLGAAAPGQAAMRPFVTERWEARYDGRSIDQPDAMAASADGSRVFVTGISEGPTSNDVVTVAFDAETGATLWVSRYDGPAHDWDEGLAIAVSPEGSMVFVGGITGGCTFCSASNYLILAMDAASGAGLWARRYNGPGRSSDTVAAIAVSPDGSKVFVTGESRGGAIQPDWATIAFEANSGRHLWVKRLGQIDHPGSATALAVSPDATTLFVTGQGIPPGYSEQRFVTVAYDAATGARKWLASYEGGAGAGAADIVVSPDGSRVFITGSIDSAPYDYDYQTIAYDAVTGAQLWAQRYIGPTYADTASAIAVSADGSRVYVTGTSDSSPGDQDFATIAYDAATGDEAWVQRFGGPYLEDDTANSIAVTPDGSIVFVAGTGPASSPNWNDFITVAYGGSDGALLGATSYDGRLHQEDREADATLSPDGSMLFETGESDELRGHSIDYAVVAYVV